MADVEAVSAAPPRAEPRELIGSRRVQPSILSADYSRLGEELAPLIEAGARVIHVDVMDGHFVPPITIGPVVVESIRDQVHEVGGLLDCHLMVERPERQIEQFASAGADSITVQAESTPNVHYALKQIRHAVDLVLCMTVNPGWGGQPFIERSPAKVRRLRELVGGDLPIQVDGGISAASARAVSDAGATLFVAGSAIFRAPDPVGAYREIAALTGAD
jgi:ribulose-phosphate 3-epimerase